MARGLLLRTEGRKVWLWDIETDAIDSLEGHIGSVNSVSFSPDGKRLAFGTEGRKVWLWNIETDAIDSLEGHIGSVNSVSFSPDGKRLASGSSDGTILFWDMSPYITSQPPTPDFDGDGTIGFGDFLEFVALFGLNQDDEGYEARFDLDGDGMIGFSDFLIFANAFGKKPS